MQLLIRNAVGVVFWLVVGMFFLWYLAIPLWLYLVLMVLVSTLLQQVEVKQTEEAYKKAWMRGMYKGFKKMGLEHLLEEGANTREDSSASGP